MKTGIAKRKQQFSLTHSIPVNRFQTQEIQCGQHLLNMNFSMYSLMQERQSYNSENKYWCVHVRHSMLYALELSGWP